MISTDDKVALVLKDSSDMQLFNAILKDFGFNKISRFESSVAAFEKVIREDHAFFIIDLNMPQMSGSVFLQKIRESGNYGLETIFFIADKVDTQTFNLFNEYDVGYVLLRPFDHKAIKEKLMHIIKSEKRLPVGEQRYREAKSAFISGLTDIAHNNVMQLIRRKLGKMEKPYVLLGDIESRRKDYFSARVAYEKALTYNPGSVAAKYKLAQTFMAEKNFDKASSILDKLAEDNQNHINLLVNAGLSSFNRGDLEKAKKHMNSVKSIDESNKKSSEVIVNIAIEEGDYQTISETLQSSHSMKDLVSYLNNTGVRLSKEKRYDEAVELFQNCLNTVKGSEFEYTVCYNLALACMKKKATTHAKKYLLRAIELKPDFQKGLSTLKRNFPQDYEALLAKKAG